MEMQNEVNQGSKWMERLIYALVVAGVLGALVGVWHSAAQPKTCIEFVADDDQSVFNSTGVIRSGANVSAKPARECSGVSLDRLTIK